jgi:hypothetical protein
MAPPPRPSSLDYFFARNQTPIIFSAFGLQVCHYQYIKRTQPAFEASRTLASASLASMPRTLKAGLGWAAVFVTLLTEVTLAKKTIRDYSDPVIKVSSQRKVWAKASQEGL